MSDDYFPAHLAAGEALWRIDGQAKVAIPLLIEALNRYPYLARGSVRTLREIGPAAQPAVPALLSVIADRKAKPILRAEAAQALKTIDAQAAAQAGIR